MQRAMIASFPPCIRKNPITGIGTCCARATSGQAVAAPPRALRKFPSLHVPVYTQQAIVAIRLDTEEADRMSLLDGTFLDGVKRTAGILSGAERRGSF